jgi:hypothetical protein
LCIPMSSLLSHLPALIFLVPQARNPDSTIRVALDHSTSFEDAQAEFYTAIGCLGIKVKPGLSYKLASATVKAKPIALKSPADWDGLLDEVSVWQGNGKGKSPFPVTIHVEERVGAISCWQKMSNQCLSTSPLSVHVRELAQQLKRDEFNCSIWTTVGMTEILMGTRSMWTGSRSRWPSFRML